MSSTVAVSGNLIDALRPMILKTIDNTIESVAEEKAIEFKEKLIRDMKKSMGKLEMRIQDISGVPTIKIMMGNL